MVERESEGQDSWFLSVGIFDRLKMAPFGHLAYLLRLVSPAAFIKRRRIFSTTDTQNSAAQC